MCLGCRKHRLSRNRSFKNLLYVAEAKGKALLPFMQPLRACITPECGYRAQKFGQGACRHKEGEGVIYCVHSFPHFPTPCICNRCGRLAWQLRCRARGPDWAIAETLETVEPVRGTAL